MKDFTKTQKKQSKRHLKCSACGCITLAFGIDVGEKCRVPIEGSSGSGDTFLCQGTLSEVNSKSVDAKKRQTDKAR